MLKYVHMENSIFSKIINREVPADIVFENDTVIVIADIQPVNPGHCLVIPKKQYADITETPDDELAECMVIAKKIGIALLKLDGVTGFNITSNIGASAGQKVFHTHIHVIPRHDGDGFGQWYGDDKAKAKQSETIAVLKTLIV